MVYITSGDQFQPIRLCRWGVNAVKMGDNLGKVDGTIAKVTSSRDTTASEANDVTQCRDLEMLYGC